MPWRPASSRGGANATHRLPARFDTADFAEPPGNIRADYVLPSRRMRITDARVFWPTSSSPLYRLTGTFPFPSSDHRLVGGHPPLTRLARSRSGRPS